MDLSGKRFLVTGGSGFVGSALVGRLLAQGAVVRAFDVVDHEDRPSAVELTRGDIRDGAAVEDACRGVDVVYHTVALVPLAKDPGAFRSVNAAGTANLLTAASQHKRQPPLPAVAAPRMRGVRGRQRACRDSRLSAA